MLLYAASQSYQYLSRDLFIDLNVIRASVCTWFKGKKIPGILY
ncbi:hypothetical protein RchiOBHm_Chr6g0269971 [Rosa chinensis]|uniref:Uncharacterized protein n=1 Tax=Rosa chinensis TaxID=74649 RepID=A0A2P6PQL5_ROSCH|nr:hypothetical protein RchiOBHm_Chr6g0269971 [Rosa chinensis]